MVQGEVAPVVSKPKQIETIAVWLKSATQKRNLNNPKFLSATKAFLLSCEAKEKIAPIIKEWERMPITNKTIENIYRVLADHYSTERLTKAERSSERKNWTVRIFGCDVLDGPMVLQKEESFADCWTAENWAVRRLCEGSSASNYYAVIDAHTEKTKLTIYRNDALARNEKREVPCMTTDQVKVSKDRLSWGCGGMYNKRYYFSRG